ncbi:hypothetical protein [Actinacidiphila sp. bgisy160]|uniref:hypothetical protein n=1 Tax=Actinacidiphila sp. bgisy160 TaxID=3413796 RepID=UPI003D72BBD9
MVELLILGWLAWQMANGSSSGGSSGGSKAASPKAKAPVAAAKRESLAAQWRATPVKKGSPTNRAGAVTGKAAAYLTRAGLGHVKAFTEGWGASWKEAASVLWERKDELDPEDDDEDETPNPEPDPPKPTPPPPPPKPTGGKAPAPPEKPTVAARPVRKPAPAPTPAPARDTGLPPSTHPYPAKPLRLVQPDERKPPTMSGTLTGEATNFDSAREQLGAVADTALADLEIATGDATRSSNRATALDDLAAGMAALKVDPETVRDAHAVAEAAIAFAEAQEAARAAAEAVFTAANVARENLQRRYGNLVEAAAAAPAIPDAEFITSH